MSEPLVPRDEARAALEARAELGPAYDDALVERFAERLERRLQAPPAERPARVTSEQRTGIAIVSLIASIPLIAIASGVGAVAVVAVCAALVLVNYVVWRN